MIQPHGFRPHASGLIVPDAVSRQREVWTRVELKLIDRAIALLKSRHVLLQLACPAPGCKGDGIERVRLDDGSIVLRCNHKDRVFTTAF